MIKYVLELKENGRAMTSNDLFKILTNYGVKPLNASDFTYSVYSKGYTRLIGLEYEEEGTYFVNLIAQKENDINEFIQVTLFTEKKRTQKDLIKLLENWSVE